MKRCLIIISAALLLFGGQTLFAVGEEQEVPANIRNNTYFLESIRLANLANLAFAEGDYIASTEYSAEAIRFTYLSDEYVLLQLKIRECDDAIAAARRRLDFADSVNASVRFPAEYNRAQTAFGSARNFRAAERWDDAIDAAHQVLLALLSVTESPAAAAPPVIAQPPVSPPGPAQLPAQYTVRPWGVSSDCFWNIAGRPWVYNDPHRWRVLYEANRSKLPEPDNPDLMHPGMVLDIPRIGGEVRQGMWNPNTTYPTYR